MNLEIKGYVNNSLIDYPGKIVSVIFLPNCNFQCPFCFNTKIVNNSKELRRIDPQEIFNHLESRRKWLDGVCLSVAGDEPVVIRNSGKLNHVPIEKLWDDKKEINTKVEPILHECQTVNFECLTKDGFKTAKEIIRHKTKELWKITTSPGNYTIKLTNAHSIFVLTKNGFCLKKTSELKVGDFLLSPCKIIEHKSQIKNIDLLEYVQDIVELNQNVKQRQIEYWDNIIKQLKDKSISQLSRETGHTRGTIRKYKQFFDGCFDLLDEWVITKLNIRHKTSKVKVPRIIPLTKELCAFLGYAVAEGSSRYRYSKYKKKNISCYQFSLGNELALAKKILNLYRNIFKSKTGVIKKKKAKTGNTEYNVIVGNELIAKFISKLIGEGFSNKHVPEVIFNTSNENKIAFLKTLAKGDGHHRIRQERTQQEFSIKTSSSRLSADVLFLAKTLGAFAWVEEDKKEGSFRVVISANSLNKLNIKKIVRTRYAFDTRVSGIPKNLLGYSPRGQKRIAREKLKKWLNLSNLSGRRKSAAIRHNFLTGEGKVTNKGRRLQFFYNLTKNWHIKEIKSIKRIKLSWPEYVYDLVVPNENSFLGGTGSLLLHNTGGEPTLHPGLPEFIRKIKNMGFLVKLDTNGTNPEMLENLIKEKLIDYVAMDIKAPLERYDEVTKSKVNKGDIEKSIDIIRNSGIDYEFRSTVLPKLHSKEDIEKMGKWLNGSKKFCIQQFRSGKTLDKKFEKEKSFTPEELKQLAEVAKPFFESVEVRGI